MMNSEADESNEQEESTTKIIIKKKKEIFECNFHLSRKIDFVADAFAFEYLIMFVASEPNNLNAYA